MAGSQWTAGGRPYGLRRADDFLAGGDLVRPALRELARAVRTVRACSYTDLTGHRLLAQNGELAQISGWIASDAGQHGEAERVYRLGLSAAAQAGDRTLAGNLAGSLAYQLANTGRGSEGLALARAALDRAGPQAPAKARALYGDRLAWAATKAGGPQNAQTAMRALGQAGEALAEDGGGAEPPDYLYWVDAGELRIMEARVYTELRRPLRAVPLLTEAFGEYDATRAREMALYLSWLAVAYLDANEPGEAAGTAERMFALSAGLPSRRAAERGRVVVGRLAEYGDVPEIRVGLEAGSYGGAQGR